MLSCGCFCRNFLQWSNYWQRAIDYWKETVGTCGNSSLEMFGKIRLTRTFVCKNCSCPVNDLLNSFLPFPAWFCMASLTCISSKYVGHGGRGFIHRSNRILSAGLHSNYDPVRSKQTLWMGNFDRLHRRFVKDNKWCQVAYCAWLIKKREEWKGEHTSFLFLLNKFRWS